MTSHGLLGQLTVPSRKTIILTANILRSLRSATEHLQETDGKVCWSQLFYGFMVFLGFPPCKSGMFGYPTHVDEKKTGAPVLLGVSGRVPGFFAKANSINLTKN